METPEIVIPEDFGNPFAGQSLIPSDVIGTLVGRYRELRTKIDEVDRFVSSGMEGALAFFIEGNRSERCPAPSVGWMFRKEGAVAALNSSFWQQAMHLTDVLDLMPAARREVWHKAIEEKTTPDFEESVVRETLADLMAQRARFFSERVDGVFRALSGEHVTNSPGGFRKRMIIARILDEHGYTNGRQVGEVNDLRAVIARLMGRDEPKYNVSERLIQYLKSHWGEWVEIDGNALKIRLYRKGTVHIEIHPDMSWRLNTILASLYPLAIPPEFRARPKHQAKDVPFIQRPLPFEVLRILSQLEPAYTLTGEPRTQRAIPNTLRFSYHVLETGKHAMAEAEQILESLGGTKTPHGWQFDYNPQKVIDQVVVSGVLPDERAFQFYPTPERVAELVLQLAQIGPHHQCLEPSAGQGGLADRMPKDRTFCVEVSALRAQILQEKGHRVECADFIAWASRQGGRYDRILMNPPFDQGRWRAHLEAAADLLSPGGRLVSVLPEGALGKTDLLPGFRCEFPHRLDRAFPGVSQRIVLAVVERL